MKNLNKVNKYKFASHIVLIAFMLLSTIQILLDLRITLGVEISTLIYVLAPLASFIPSIFLIFLMNLITKKTKYINLFVIPEIKSIIRILFYISVFGVFILWSISLITVVGFNIGIAFPLCTLSKFLISKVLYSIVYSSVVVSFFYGLSDLDLKRIRNNEL